MPPRHEIAVGEGAARSRRVLSGLLRAAGRSGCGAVLAGLAGARHRPCRRRQNPPSGRCRRSSGSSGTPLRRAAALASLEAARGETESFQIVVRADDEELKEVSIGVGDLKGPGGAVIPARNHVLYREHYVVIRRDRHAGRQAGPLCGRADPVPRCHHRPGAGQGRAEGPGRHRRRPGRASPSGSTSPSLPGRRRAPIAGPGGQGPAASGWAADRWSSRCGTWRSRRRPPCARRSTSGTTIRWPRTRRCSPRR